MTFRIWCRELIALVLGRGHRFARLFQQQNNEYFRPLGNMQSISMYISNNFAVSYLFEKYKYF